MVCIYCGGNTKVTNSRPQVRLYQTWRRRTCIKCHALFSTIEVVDFTTSLVVKDSKGTLKPFNRDQLFVSVLQSVGHRRDALNDARALTSTITALLLREAAAAVLSSVDIIRATHRTLQRFDKAAAVQYAAYHYHSP